MNSPSAKVLLRKTLVTPHLRRPPEGGFYSGRRGLHIVRDDFFKVIAHSFRRSSSFKTNPLCWALF
jgi:hypothetical protein